MSGRITTRHLLTHSAVIVREFGARCFARCVWRALTERRPVTFLECVNEPPLPLSIRAGRR